jgi:CRP/FNR family transcriptional regulator
MIGELIYPCVDCTECSDKIPFFNLLSGEELGIINRNRFSVKFKPHELILKQGLTATHVISLIHGIAKMYIEGLHNKNILLRLVGSWQLINEANASSNELNQFSVAALTDVQVCFIEAENFKKVLEMNGKFACEVIRHRNKQSTYFHQKMVSLTQKHMLGRMADGLLYLSNEFYKSNSFEMNLSRQDLADLTAMSKDSAIRILKEFEKDGIISQHGKQIRIIDRDTLFKIAMNG